MDSSIPDSGPEYEAYMITERARIRIGYGLRKHYDDLKGGKLWFVAFTTEGTVTPKEPW